MTQAKAIKIQEKTKLPADLSKPNAELDSYLATLKEAYTEEEKHMNRYRRMRSTRIQNALAKSNIAEAKDIDYAKSEILIRNILDIE